MSGQLRDIVELEAEIEAAAKFGLTKAQILDLLRSQAKVAGTLSVKNGTASQTTVGGWNRLDLFDTSRDTQGVREGLLDTPPGGYFTVRNAGSGDYTCQAMVRFTVDTAGDYEFRVTSADDDAVPDTFESNNSPFHDEVTLGVGETGHIVIASALLKNIEAGNRLQLEYRGPNGSQITVLHAQFGVER